MNSLSAARRRGASRAISLLLIALLAAVAAIPLAAVWQAFGPKSAAPDFTLVDGDSHPFRLTAQRGHPVVLFFGYTHCPDACPTTLANIARAVHQADVPRDVRVAFITVDPARDSPPLLARYVRLFDPQFTGLTGSAQALAPVYAAYHVWRSAVPPDRIRSGYVVGHGTTLYYIGRNGSLKAFGTWDDPPSSIARTLKELG